MQLDGPRLLPRSGGKPDSLVILLHGVAANGNDLLFLAHAWQAYLSRIRNSSPPTLRFRVTMRLSAGNGSACRTARRKNCSQDCATLPKFSITFSMNCWPAVGSATPA
jgi:hypothetical protein